MNQKNLQEEYKARLRSVDEVLELVKDNQSVFPSGVVCEPREFLSNFHKRVPYLHGVTMHKGRCDVDYPFLHMPDLAEHVQVMGHLFDKPMRKAYEEHNVTPIPSFLHDFAPNQIRTRGVDVFVAMATPMDENGVFYVSGCRMWEQEACEAADVIILEVNPLLPKFHGSVEVPMERVTAIREVNYPIMEFPTMEPTENDRIIGEYCKEFVKDGCCIQLGIGGLPNYLGESFMDRKELGVHTEVFTPVMAKLIDSGVVTGERKNIDTSLHIGTFIMGDMALYNSLAANPRVRFRSASYTNSLFKIAQIDNMISLNTALEIDLSGQVCSESIGAKEYSGTGGAFDFAYGAQHSKGGWSIIALNSTAKNGTISKIKPVLTPGAVVSISRNAVDVIVTEYGVAYMCGRSVRERAEQLINIAHPDFREDLRKQARELLYI